MMAQKHLHELLQEDQEPFVLKKFIADRRCQLKNPSPKRTHLQINKRKPQNFSSNFCKNACFFADSTKKSPLFEFQSPIKSPCKSPIFLQIPSRTAALLLEAALRIQKQSTKTKNNGGSFNLFGSILKRITHRSKNPKLEIGDGGSEVSVKDILKWESKNDKQRKRKTLSVIEEHQSGRPSSSAVWSEKSMDLDSSCSCSQSEDFEEIFISKDFCESPFHFVLQKSPSFCHGTPLLSSPTTSPSRRQKENNENYEAETSKKLQVAEAEEEEEKEQCSPVSVLDPLFEDDDDRHVDDDEDGDENDDNDDENDGFDLECSYANMQRAKQQLLYTLRRFEKLAELDPVELEKRMLEDYLDDNSGICDLEEEEELENESVSSDSTETSIDAVIKEVFKSSFRNPGRVPDGMKRLIYDLVAEEEADDIDRETVAKRVCKRLESWKDVESNTIDMMVGQDFKRLELKGDQEQIKETATQLEYAIFGLLMDELSEELVCLTEI